MAETPGLSGTSVTVILDSDRSWVTARMMGRSMSGSSSGSSVTRVPGSHVKAERMCNGTRWLWATSTDRMAGFGQPVAVISNSSSKLIEPIRVAVGTTRGSAVNTPLIDQTIATDSPGSIIESKKSGRLADPEKIIDAIDKGVAKGKWVIYPGEARLLMLWHTRFPGLWWKTVLKFED